MKNSNVKSSFPRHFCPNKSCLRRSGFKFQTASLSALNVTLQVQLLSAVNERFPGMACKFFLKHFVTIPVTPAVTGMYIHFMLLQLLPVCTHISCCSSCYRYVHTFHVAPAVTGMYIHFMLLQLLPVCTYISCCSSCYRYVHKFHVAPSLYLYT